MRSPIIASVLLLATTITAQRFDGQFWPCNPLKNATGACPPNRGLPTRTYSVDFTKQTAVPANWTVSNYATVGFGAQGAEFTFNKRWDAPQLWTDFFILFGKVSIVARVANGTGMISSAVLMSDVFDEIDFEMSGNNFGHEEWSAGKGQNNYFGKGVTGNYDRGSYFDVFNPQGSFHTYTFDWSPTELKWLVDGRVVRTHLASDSDKNAHQYPQTPSKFQLGIWAGGDPSSNQGTREWAGGYTDLDGGPYTMFVKSVVIENAMPAWGYNYTDRSGDWRSIGLLKEPVSPPVVSTSSSKSTSKSADVSSKSSVASSSTMKPSTVKASTTTIRTPTTLSKTVMPNTTSKSSTKKSSSTVKPSSMSTKTSSKVVTSPTSKTSTKTSTKTVSPSSTTKSSKTTLASANTQKPPAYGGWPTSKSTTKSTSTSTSVKRPSAYGETPASKSSAKSSSASTPIRHPSAYGATPASKSSASAVSKQPTATALSIVSKVTVVEQSTAKAINVGKDHTVAHRPTATTVNGVKFVYSYTTTTKCTTTATPKPKQYQARAAEESSASDWEYDGWSNQWHDRPEHAREKRHGHAHRH